MTDVQKTRLCFIGNLLGRNEGYISTQGQIVADLFSAHGYSVVSASSQINKAKRLLEIVSVILKNRNQIDVLIQEVYSGASMVTADIVSRLCKIFNIKQVSVLHGGNLPSFTAQYPRWTKGVLKRADVLIAPSEFLAKSLSFLGLEVRVIPNVIDLKDYPFRQRSEIKTPQLFWMRSFDPIYNPELALKVLAELRKTEPAVRLVMAGKDKGIKERARKFAADLKLEDAVSFREFLDTNGKVTEFSKADVYLNTNHIDNMPVSVLESCAMGVPVVATKVGGVPYLISDEQTGLLVPDDDSEAMVQAIKKLLENPSLVSRLSSQGRRLAEQSGWENVRLQWEKIFRELSE